MKTYIIKVNKRKGDSKMFKKIIAAIAKIDTMDDYNAVCGMVDIAFQQEKISYNDHELLYDLLGKVMPN